MEIFATGLLLLSGQKNFFNWPEPSLDNTDKISHFDVVPL